MYFTGLPAVGWVELGGGGWDIGWQEKLRWMGTQPGHPEIYFRRMFADEDFLGVRASISGGGAR